MFIFTLLITLFFPVDESRQFSAHAIATIAILLVLGQKQILLLPLPSALINVANISVRALLAGFNAFAVEFVLQAPHYMKADTKLSTLAARNLEMDKCLKVFELITFRRPTTPCSSFPTCMDSPVSITCTATLESSVLPTTAPPLFSPTFLPEDHILGHKRRPSADSFPFKRRLSFGEQQDL